MAISGYMRRLPAPPRANDVAPIITALHEVSLSAWHSVAVLIMYATCQDGLTSRFAGVQFSKQSWLHRRQHCMWEVVLYSKANIAYIIPSG